MRRARDAREDVSAEESLVPMIEEEERRLEKMLEEARSEAERLVEAADREAERAEAELAERIPALQEEKRKAAAARFEEEAERLRSDSSDAVASLRRTMEAGGEAAVRRVVASVWPIGR